MGQLVEQFGLVGQIRLGRRLQFGCIRRELRQFLGGHGVGAQNLCTGGYGIPDYQPECRNDRFESGMTKAHNNQV
ncbi:hypothetical protein GCM10017056_23590 [Seohaeicola zhoushanensis]|uniref:Uncharacterized protein n=1 Tax=Seohaeicola zhoushanensis TaxID=1569283 RepID=A0A8J3GYH1_9RHOB|nr:hypothetical protein GCM10017056_23590 [Seohaeicola zhoushanensis]